MAENTQEQSSVLDKLRNFLNPSPLKDLRFEKGDLGVPLESANQEWKSLVAIDFPVEQSMLRNINLEEELTTRKDLVNRIFRLKRAITKRDRYSSREDEEHDRYQFRFIRSELAELASFESDQLEDGYPKDKIYRKLMTVAQEFEAKRSWGHGIEKDLGACTIKAEIVRLLSPGSFLAHGGYCDSLPEMLDNGGLSSVATRFLKGNIEKISGHTVFGTGSYKRVERNPHNSAVWFYHWQGTEKAGTYAGPVPEKDFAWRCSDMTILYPAEIAVANSRIIHIDPFITPGKGAQQEIGLTNSEKALKSHGLVYDSRDNTCLPLTHAYFILASDKAEEAKESFLSHGFSEEWWQDHVFLVDIERWQEKAGGEEFSLKNNMDKVLLEKKVMIDQWLFEKISNRGQTIVKILPQPNETTTFYTADFIPTQR